MTDYGDRRFTGDRPGMLFPLGADALRGGRPLRDPRRGAVAVLALLLLGLIGGVAPGLHGTGAVAADRANQGWPSDLALDPDRMPSRLASTAVRDVTDRPLTVLVMGVDARPGEPIDVGVRPDALGVLRLDPAAGTCRLLAVPRDTRADLPWYGPSKVNHGLVVGGVPFQRRVVEGLLGLEIDRFVLVDFAAVEAIVEAVGGVTLDVPQAFTTGDGRSFPAGAQTLDGPAVLAYARYRDGPDGDLGRIGRQQQVLRALLERMPDLELGPALAGLLPLLEEHVRTDLSPAEIVGLARRFRPSCTGETLWLGVLDGATATLDDPLVGQPLSYLLVEEAEIDRKRALLFDDEAPTG